jgi:hypothetical protein
VSGTAVEFAARDGYRLAGTLYRPRTPNRRAVLLQAAAGVKQEYYGKFAEYLASRGFAALTFDYRGIGRSRPPKLRGFKASMRDWAEKDIGGALDYLARASHGARLIGIGHSFGALAFGLVPGNERYVAVMTVGAQSGYWRHWRGAGRAGMWLVTHMALPAMSRLCGYLSRHGSSAKARTCPPAWRSSGRGGADIRAISSARSRRRTPTRALRRPCGCTPWKMIAMRRCGRWRPSSSSIRTRRAISSASTRRGWAGDR